MLEESRAEHAATEANRKDAVARMRRAEAKAERLERGIRIRDDVIETWHEREEKRKTKSAMALEPCWCCGLEEP